MGRNTKEGLSYFPMDVDIYDDEKLQFVTARFGIKGDGIVARLLCRIYRQGYYLNYDSDVALLFARSVGDVSLHGLVNDVVNECLKRGFFNEDIFKRFGVLTSAGIQKRYALICTLSKRKSWKIIPEYYLLPSKQIKIPEEIALTPEETPQSKVKESKVKDDGDLSPPAPPKPPKPGEISPYNSLEANKRIALADHSMNGFYETYIRAGIAAEKLPIWMDAYHRQLSHDGDTLKQQRDYRKHFANWIKFQDYTTGRPEDFSPVKKMGKKQQPDITHKSNKRLL